MPSARSDLFIYIGVALATTIGLFVVHWWYGSYLDVRHHARLEDGGNAEALLASRDEDQKLIAAGKIPLAQAMDAYARGSGRAASIAPAPSEDISAVSGWIYARGFKPATAHPVRAPKARPAAAATPVPAQEAPAEPAAEGSAPADPAAPLPKPTLRPLRLKTEVVRPQPAQ